MSDGTYSPGCVDTASEVRGEDIWPVYLPVVGVADAQPLYQEALMRTRLDCGHQALIAAAEERGFVGQIDCAVLTHSIDLLRRTPDRLAVGVNFSAGTLDQGSDRWLAMLSDAEDVSGRIFVELTETQIFDDLKKLADFVAACRKFGVRFALDDFESNHFDGALVKVVAPDLIKLSKVWSGGYLGAQARLSRLLEAVSKLGVSDVVVEWVDCEWKFDLVSSLPISYAQGLFVGRHFSAGELIAACGPEDRSFCVAAKSLFASCR